MFPLLWGTERLRAEQFPRQEPDTLRHHTSLRDTFSVRHGYHGKDHFALRTVYCIRRQAPLHCDPNGPIGSDAKGRILDRQYARDITLSASLPSRSCACTWGVFPL